MSECFVGEIRIFAGNYAPEGWALCQGQMLAIAENDVLYSLIGTTYGGDGRTNFALPDLRSRIVCGTGQGTNLSSRPLGQRFGTETETLTTANLPAHTHTAYATATAPAQPIATPENAILGPLQPTSANAYITPVVGGETPTPTVQMNQSVLEEAGGSASHTNIEPVLAVNFIIALRGQYPLRS